MAIQRHHALLPVELTQIPYLYGPVIRAGNQPSIGQYRDKIHPVGMPIQRYHALLPIGLAQIPHLYGLVIRAGSQPPIGQFCDRFRPVGMHVQRHHTLLSVGLAKFPHLYGLVIRAGSQPPIPSASAVTEFTHQPLCLVATHCFPLGLLRSHNFMVPSPEQEASCPFANALTEFTLQLCPFSVATQVCPALIPRKVRYSLLTHL